MTFKMPANKVLVRRVGMNDIRGDVQVADAEGFEHTLLPNIGVVVDVCRELRFTKPIVKILKKTGASLREVQEITRISCSFLTHIEARPGDLVIYRRLNNVADADTVYSGGREEALLVIEHDDLIARVDGDTLYPLAGNVLVSDTAPENVTQVVAVGKPVIEYFDHDENDFDTDITGMCVIANMKQAAPVGDIVYAPGKSAAGLAYIKRRYILLKYEAQPGGDT